MDATYKRNLVLLLGMAVAIGILLRTQVVYAEEADLHYGSEWYESEAEGSFPIALYIEAESDIGAYEIILHYDPEYLGFIDGAELLEDGQLRIAGDLQGQSGRFMMHFRTLMEGETSIDVASAVLVSMDGGEVYDISQMPSAPILINPHVTPPYTGITINGMAVRGFMPERQSYEMSSDYTDWFDTVVEGAVTTNMTIEVVDDLTRLLHISARDSAGKITNYQVRVHMEPRPDGSVAEDGAQQDGAENENPDNGDMEAETVTQEGEALPGVSQPMEETGENQISDEKQTEEEEPVTVYQAQRLTDDELKEIIHENRRESMLKAVIVLAGIVFLMTAVVIIPVIMNGKPPIKMEYADTDGQKDGQEDT